MLKLLNAKGQLLNNHRGNVVKAGNRIANLISRDAPMCAQSLGRCSHSFVQSQSHTVISTSTRPTQVPLIRTTPRLHARDFTTSAVSHEGSRAEFDSTRQQFEHFLLKVPDETPSSTRVSWSIDVKGHSKKDAWETFPVLQFVHWDKYMDDRLVFLALHKTEFQCGSAR